MTRLPELDAQITETGAVADVSQATELDELARSIPKLVEILPDVLRNRDDPRHNAALAEMIGGLMFRLDRVRPLALVCCDFILGFIHLFTVSSHSHKSSRF